MTTTQQAIARRDAASTSLTATEPPQFGDDLESRIRYARALAEAGLLPASYRKQPANVLLAMEYAEALDVKTITVIQQVHVIDGKPTASAQFIGSLVHRAGHRLRVRVDPSGTSARATIVRRDDPGFEFESVWTLDRARVAGLLGKGTWKAYPTSMLKARAITEVARDACPEVLSGVAYTAEELGDESGATWSSGPVQDDPWMTTAIEATREPEPVPAADPDTGEIVDADVVDDDPSAASEDEPPREEPMVTPAQTKMMAALMKALGITSREDALRYCADVIRRDIESRNDLTAAEASQIIDALNADKVARDAGEALMAGDDA